MDPAIEILYHEHEVILAAADKLEQLLNSEDRSEYLSYEFSELLAFFREYGDGIHHQKEEDMLFSRMERIAPDLKNALLGELTEQHETFRQLLNNAEDFLHADDLEGFRVAMNAYLRDLRDHIAAENDELFVMAGDLIHESELERMAGEFEDRDRECGEGWKQEWEDRILVTK